MSNDISRDDWLKDYYKREKKKRVSLINRFSKLANFLVEKGFNYLTIEYEGAGDSGDCMTTRGFKDKEMETLDLEQYQFLDEGREWDSKENKYIQNGDRWAHAKYREGEVYKAVEEYNSNLADDSKDRIDPDLGWELCEFIDYDWINNEGGQGTLIFNLEEKVIEVDGTQNVCATEDVEESINLNTGTQTVKYDGKDVAPLI